MFARAEAGSEFARDVRGGLCREGQKELPCRYFYDEVGSALFEVITRLPEYGLARADVRLVRKHAPELVRRLDSPLLVAELGSGGGSKTRWILEALKQREPVVYYPIDISGTALAACAKELAPLGEVIPLERPYLDGLGEVSKRRRAGEHLLLLFLGSTIGNFNRAAAEAFLSDIRGGLRPGDALLLGADLEKAVPRMLAAYNDAVGVTAAFNLNLLARINRELDGDFVLRNFAHEARYSARERRVEMHLRSLVEQTVAVSGAGITVELAAGETIWTESCHKFRLEDIRSMAHRAGFRCEVQWVDPEWPFTESLLVA